MTRVLIIGLDGVPLQLIRRWAEQGDLPTFRRLMREGAVGHLRSTLPATSAPAWSSFMTGMNPGKTGVYDFLYRRPGTYTFFPNNARRRAGRSLWRILSEAGKRVGVMNVPLSYPVEPVNGFIISGWMTPYTARDVAYPAYLLPELERHVGAYRIYPAATFSEKRRDAYFRACHHLLTLRTRAAYYLLTREPWDFFMVVFFDTDRILHQLWHDLAPDHPWNRALGRSPDDTALRRYFQHLDASVDRLVQAAGEDALVILMSDHGMGPARDMIVLNNWLWQVGLLRLRTRFLSRMKERLFRWGFTLSTVHEWVDRLGLAKQAEYRALYSVDALLKKVFLSFDDVDWSQSLAYSFGRDVGPIYLNVKGREPGGIVPPGQPYLRLRDEIADMAREMRDPTTGRRLVGQVLYREEVYHGPYLEEAPDLILVPARREDVFYGLADFGANRLARPMYRYSGMHRDLGLVILHGRNVRPGRGLTGAEIIDVAPTVLHALGVPLPAEMDGRVLQEAFWPERMNAPVRVNAPPALRLPARHGEYTPREALAVEVRLRQLGYLG